MWTMVMMLLAGAASGSQVTAIKVSPLTIFNQDSVAVGKLAGSELPPMPLPISGINEFGYFQVLINGREVFIRPADVRHNVVYCAGGDVARRESGAMLGGAKPGGVRKGAGEDDAVCIPQ